MFETNTLAAGIKLTASVVAHLHAGSSPLDTDVTMKLVYVYLPNADYPRVYAMHLAHGILRTRFRGAFDYPEPMEPGTIFAQAHLRQPSPSKPIRMVRVALWRRTAQASPPFISCRPAATCARLISLPFTCEIRHAYAAVTPG